MFLSGWEWFCNLSAEYSVLRFWLCVVFSPPVRLEKYGNHLKNTEKNIFLNILAVILYSNVKLTVLIWIFLETDVLSSSLSRFVYYYYYDDGDDDDDYYYAVVIFKTNNLLKGLRISNRYAMQIYLERVDVPAIVSTVHSCEGEVLML